MRVAIDLHAHVSGSLKLLNTQFPPASVLMEVCGSRIRHGIVGPFQASLPLTKEPQPRREMFPPEVDITERHPSRGRTSEALIGDEAHTLGL
jgi:hypothetical protein